MSHKLHLTIMGGRPRLKVVRTLPTKHTALRVGLLTRYEGWVNTCTHCGTGFIQGEAVWVNTESGEVFHASRDEAARARATSARIFSCRRIHEVRDRSPSRPVLQIFAGRKSSRRVRVHTRRTSFW